MNIFKYIAYRFIALIAQVVGSIAVIFAFVTTAPNNSFALFTFNNPNATEEEIALFKHRVGLDRTGIERFTDYLINLSTQGSLGTSIDGIEVRDLYFDKLQITFSTFGWGFLIYTILAVVLGIISASKVGEGFDTSSRLITSFFYSFPPYVLGTLFLFYSTQIEDQNVSENILEILPVATVVLIYTGFQFRLVRMYMINALNKNYIRTAHAKGLPNQSIVVKHALRNALPEIINSVAITFPIAFSGIAVLEIVYQVRGSGRLLIDASLAFDWPIIIGGAVLFTIINATILAITDVIVHYISPQLRLGKKSF